jgi:hypothetical protein
MNSVRKLFIDFGIPFPQNDIIFEEFKSLLKKLKFYRFLIPFLKVINPIWDDDDDDNIDSVYEKFQLFGLYDVTLLLFFEQMDINWQQKVDCRILEKGLNAVITLNRNDYSDIIFQRITHNKTNVTECTFEEFTDFIQILNTQLGLIKTDFMTKMLFDTYSDLKIPLSEQKKISQWTKSQIIDIWKKHSISFSQEFAFLINKDANVETINRKSFVNRYYDPCVNAYMSKLAESIYSQFDNDYAERMKRFVD